MRSKSMVPAAQWRRGVAATERIGRLLKEWEERGKSSRSGAEPSERPPRRPRRQA